MPTRKGYGAPQRPHRPQHKPQPEQNQSLAQPPSRRRTNPKDPCYEGISIGHSTQVVFTGRFGTCRHTLKRPHTAIWKATNGTFSIAPRLFQFDTLSAADEYKQVSFAS